MGEAGAFVASPGPRALGRARFGLYPHCVDMTVEVHRPAPDRNHRRLGPDRDRPRRGAPDTPVRRHQEHSGRASAHRSAATLEAVQDLAERARHERTSRWLFSPDRAYYLGVETAAEQVLHPEVEVASNVSWLDLQHPAFVMGFLETVATLAPLWSWSSSGTAPSD